MVPCAKRNQWGAANFETPKLQKLKSMNKDSEPFLVVLAAGMGSRYGGTKQLDGVGPNGETLMEYSLFDAQRAGFRNVLFGLFVWYYNKYDFTIWNDISRRNFSR